MSKAAFLYILGKIRHDIKKDVLTEDPISPECRLAICLYRLGRGDYLFTISEMTGYGVVTVCQILTEVSSAIVKNLWTDSVACHFTKNEETLKNAWWKWIHSGSSHVVLEPLMDATFRLSSLLVDLRPVKSSTTSRTFIQSC